jgi:hypothetical protein
MHTDILNKQDSSLASCKGRLWSSFCCHRAGIQPGTQPACNPCHVSQAMNSGFFFSPRLVLVLSSTRIFPESLPDRLPLISCLFLLIYYIFIHNLWISLLPTRKASHTGKTATCQIMSMKLHNQVVKVLMAGIIETYVPFLTLGQPCKTYLTSSHL